MEDRAAEAPRPAPDAEAPRLTPDAEAFVRFCYARRRVGWPDLYDEMCLVASRRLFRGWGSAELAEHGVGFGLHDLAGIADLARRVVAVEQAARRAAGPGGVGVRVPVGPAPGTEAETIPVVGPVETMTAVARR